jgi:hypothetical protein
MTVLATGVEAPGRRASPFAVGRKTRTTWLSRNGADAAGSTRNPLERGRPAAFRTRAGLVMPGPLRVPLWRRRWEWGDPAPPGCREHSKGSALTAVNQSDSPGA